MRGFCETPCPSCGSHYWVGRYGEKCDKCPPSLTFVVLDFLAVALVLALIFGGMALYGRWAYGDWTCAFKNCVEVR